MPQTQTMSVDEKLGIVCRAAALYKAGIEC